MLLIFFFYFNQSGTGRIFYKKHYENIFNREDTDLQSFDFQIIAQATGNFSSSNKLGEGGFGPVYKVLHDIFEEINATFHQHNNTNYCDDNFQGILRCEQVLAVKRLSNKSGQGLEEFKNEMVVIAKLQHRNLVKLLGYCIEGEEVMLIYEYMPNKSLDNFIFGLILYQLISYSFVSNFAKLW